MSQLKKGVLKGYKMLFWKTTGKIHLYEGKYKDSVGPETSQIWKDFEQ